MNRRGLLKIFGVSAIVPVPTVTALLEALDPKQPPVLLGEIETIAPTYRLAGQWGAGKGEALTATELDMNFWLLHQRIAVLERALKERE